MERHRIRTRLRKALQFPITILQGVAGCGKSFALRDVLLIDGRPNVIFDVAPEHATLARFVAGFADALAAHAPGARLAFASAYERAILSEAPAAALAHWLHEHIKQLELTIVVDNFHHAEGVLVQSFLGKLIDRGGVGLRWMIACRSADDLPIANWLASARMGLPVEDDELAFTASEIEQLAHERQLPFGAAEGLDVFARTEGWATGVAFLLQMSAAHRSYRSAVRGFEPIIEKMLADCDADELRALVLTSYLPDLSTELLGELGGDSLVRQIETLRQRAPSLFIETPSALRFHTLFTDALIALRRDADGSVRPGNDEDRVVRALLTLGRYVDVLNLRLAGNLSGVVASLEEHGIELLERGQLDLVEAAIVRLDKARVDLPPRVIALRAIVESRLGRTDTAEAWFNQAINKAASDDVGMIEVKYLYACDLLHRERRDSRNLLREHVDDPRIGDALRAGILSALAEALQLEERSEEARKAIEAAIDLDEKVGDPMLHARVLTRAAYVLHMQEDYATARAYATTAAELAHDLSAFTVEAGAQSILYVIEFNSGNIDKALKHIGALMESCLRSGNIQFQFYCLATSYEIEVERNNLAAIARIEETLADFDLHFSALASEQAFLPGDAMRSATHGEFDRAYRLLEPTAAFQTTQERIAQRWSEVALYALGSMRFADAKAAIERAMTALAASIVPAARLTRSRLYLALAFALLGCSAEAQQMIDAVNAEAEVPERLREIGSAVEALCEYARGAQNHALVASTLQTLHECSLGGFARVFEALPSRYVFMPDLAV